MKNKIRPYFFKLLGAYQIVCGLWGISVLISAFTIQNLLLILPFIALLFISGISLLIKINSQTYKWTFYNQVLQIIQFNFYGYGFKYAAGVYLSLGLDALDLGHLFVDYRFWTFICYFYFNSPGSDFYLSINFLPILILLFMVLFIDSDNLKNPVNPDLKSSLSE